jgi:hypothetical protein
MLAWFTIGLGACGGRVDDPGPAPSGPGSTTNVDVKASADGCTRACSHLATCAPGSNPGVPTCVSACQHDFDDAHATRFGDCIEALACTQIVASLTMNYGPVGACYSQAR